MKYNEIKDLIIINNNRGGVMYNEKYVKKHYIEVYNKVMEFSTINDLLELPYNQKSYHFVHDIKEKYIKCNNCNCDKYVKFDDSNRGYHRYCSNRCVGSDPNIINQKENKSLEKFGTKTPAESDIIKQKIINTNIERYGTPYPYKDNLKDFLIKNNVDNVSQIDYIKEKARTTKYKRYGNRGYNNLEQIKKTNLEKYGYEYTFQSELVKEKIRKKFLEKYGFDSASKSDVVRNKVKETMLKLYNCENPSQSEYVQKVKRINLINKTLKRYHDMNIIDVDYDNKIFKFKCEKGHDYTISFEMFQNRKRIKTIICTECNPIYSNNISGMEKIFQEYIKSVYSEIIEFSRFNLIKPYQLDIYLPDLKLAFEFNGVWWHSEKYVESNYHLKKTELCEEQGIKLIHIFQDDWMYKQDIIKSQILNLLDKTPNKIFATKCIIKEISDNNVIRQFLEENHQQGFIGGQVKLGLFYNDELVSLMTFGRQRKSMGTKNYEMLRFCNKLNTFVMGGANKLFKHFIDNYNPIEIISYDDRSWSQKELYKQLGFDLIHETKPIYYYIIDGVRKHRFLFRKDLLIKQGFDSNKTEREIMLERKIYRIYDSGGLKFIYNKK